MGEEKETDIYLDFSIARYNLNLIFTVKFVNKRKNNACQRNSIK